MQLSIYNMYAFFAYIIVKAYKYFFLYLSERKKEDAHLRFIRNQCI